MARHMVLKTYGGSLRTLRCQKGVRMTIATTFDTLPSVRPQAEAPAKIEFAWLEITPNCQLTCDHCYVASGPGLGHGKMSLADWKRTLDGLRSMGVEEIQFIGGEATTHPHFCELVEYAARLGFSIEVYTNLIGITQRMWSLFTRHNVKIATSFYSAEPRVHDAITHLVGSHQRTVRNIKKALDLGLTLRVGIIDVRDDQDIPAAEVFLKDLGVDPDRIGTDRVRGVGRGLNLSHEDPVSALCGKCTSGRCAITAEGTVYPCIMARTFPVGNVLEQEIRDVLTGAEFASARDTLSNAFAVRDHTICNPVCNPQTGCNPICTPFNNCNPYCRPGCKP